MMPHNLRIRNCAFLYKRIDGLPRPTKTMGAIETLIRKRIIFPRAGLAKPGKLY